MNSRPLQLLSLQRIRTLLVCAAATIAASCGGGGGGIGADHPEPGGPAGGLEGTVCGSIAGEWVASERATVACAIGGTESEEATDTITIRQNGCRFAYERAGLPREGSIEGQSLSGGGAFAKALPGIVFGENRLVFEGLLSGDGRTIDMTAHGRVTGTADGQTETCTATSTATLTRSYDVAVAVLRGGPVTLPNSDSEPHNVSLAQIASRLGAIDPARIAHRVFDASAGTGPFRSQSEQVLAWLADLSVGSTPPSTILIGHSLGGHAALAIGYSKICARVALDPVDDTRVLGNMDQHTLTLPALPGAPVVDFIAAAPSRFLGLELWGYRLSGTNVTRRLVEGSDHATIPKKVLEDAGHFGLVMELTRQCLEKSTKQ